MCVSCFPVPSVWNICQPSIDVYSVNYTQCAHRNACGSSCKVSVIVVWFKTKLDHLNKFELNTLISISIKYVQCLSYSVETDGQTIKHTAMAVTSFRTGRVQPHHESFALSMARRYGCTNPRHHITKLIKFCTVAPNIGGFSGWNLLYVTLLVSKFWCGP